jgi:hypothetical protein
MAFEIPGKMITFITAASFVTSQYTGVALNSTGKTVVPAAGAAILGVGQNNPATGERQNVMLDGVTKMLSGGAVTPGDVSVDSLGRAVNTSGAGVASGAVVVGERLEGCTRAGILIPVRITRKGTKA